MKHRWRSLVVAGVLVLAGIGVVAHPALAAVETAHGEPTLGLRTGTFADGSGWGQVRPKTVYNGGDPTGLVTSISWHGWGDAQAIGAGRGLYVAPGQAVAQGTIEPVRIVAFDLGTCNGRYMYAAVEWYFPQHKQTFNAGQFEDTCIGAYYPLPTGQYQNGTGADYYRVTLSGTPGSLGGSIARVTGKTSRTVFSFRGNARVNGNLTLVSRGPAQTGRTFTGTWATSDVVLANCRSYLPGASSCTFYF
jgi:hypothetical protein